MDSSTYRLEIGDFEILIVKDGTVGVRPLADLVEMVPADLARREIFMEGGLMVIDVPGRRILVDAGNAPDSGPRTHTAEAAFCEHGIRPESIDLILLTHGDPDHIGGLLTLDGELAYPRASVVLSAELWDAFRSDPREGLYFAGQARFIRRLVPRIQDRVTRIDAESEIVPGVRAVPGPGHRTGHTVYRFASGGQILYQIGDAAFDPLFLERTELVIGQEYRPPEARATREALAGRAAAESALVVGSHFDVSNVGRLRPAEIPGRFTWERAPDPSRRARR